MLQNAQASADISRPADTYDLLTQSEASKVVVCSICQAAYRPAFSQRATAQRSCAVLEAAFLRVCHFCFRCQRPACPQCWNPVHAVCVACGEEARLPFLAPVPSLEGLVFAPSVFPHLAQAADVPFACLRNGRFALVDPTPSGKIPIVGPAKTSPRLDPLTPAELPAVQVERTIAASHYPSWLQEIMGHQAEEYAAEVPVQRVRQVASGQEENGSWSALAENVSMLEESAWPAWWQEVHTSPQQVGLLVDGIGAQEMVVVDAPRASVDEEVTLIERIENVLIVIMSVILLTLVVMIALSVRSASVNEFFLRLLHVDIRSEIAYLFQSI